MSTINSKSIIDRLILNKGQLDGDPTVFMIVEYTNEWGGICWGVTWVSETPERRIRYTKDEGFVHSPKIIFDIRDHATL